MSTLKTKKVQLGDNADPSKNFLIETPAVADGTLSIKRQDGTNVLSIDAAGKAVIPGVVGTVAQVGGVPTGQVVERGSNANGEYVRFADGTQICTGVSAAATTSTGYPTVSGLFYTPSETSASFAAAFIAVPTVSAARLGETVANGWLNTASVTTSQAGFRQWSGSSISTATVRYAAIGRWF